MRFAILAAVLSLFAQEKSKIEVRAKKGDKVTVRETKEVSGSFTVSAGGQEQELENREKSLEHYTDEIVAVDETGWPVEVKRSFREWWKEEKKPNMDEPVKESSPLEGQTVTLKLDGKKTKVDGAKGTIDDPWMKDLKLKKNIFIRSLPSKPVEKGASWTIESADLIADFDEDREEGNPMKMEKGSATGTLQDNAGGVLTIVYDIKMEGAMYDGVKVVLTMTLTAKIDGAKARMISLDGEGKMEFDGEATNQGQKFGMKGSMKLKNAASFSYE